MATRRVSKNLQRRRSGGEGTGDTCENISGKNKGETAQAQSSGCLVNRFWGRRLGEAQSMLQIAYIFESKRSTDRNEGFLEAKEAEAKRQMSLPSELLLQRDRKICVAQTRLAVSKYRLDRKIDVFGTIHGIVFCSNKLFLFSNGRVGRCYLCLVHS